MTATPTNCDMFRASSGIDEVGVSYETLVQYESMGLPCYEMGPKTKFYSRSEVAMFIRIMANLKKTCDIVPKTKSTP